MGIRLQSRKSHVCSTCEQIFGRKYNRDQHERGFGRMTHPKAALLSSFLNRKNTALTPRINVLMDDHLDFGEDTPRPTQHATETPACTDAHYYRSVQCMYGTILCRLLARTTYVHGCHNEGKSLLSPRFCKECVEGGRHKRRFPYIDWRFPRTWHWVANFYASAITLALYVIDS